MFPELKGRKASSKDDPEGRKEKKQKLNACPELKPKADAPEKAGKPLIVTVQIFRGCHRGPRMINDLLFSARSDEESAEEVFGPFRAEWFLSPLP